MKKDNFDVHKWNNMQKLASIINESDPQLKKYTVDDFILRHADKDFFKSFIKAIYDSKAQLDPDKEEDWEKIIRMDEKTLTDTYKLTTEIAKKIKDQLDKDTK